MTTFTEIFPGDSSGDPTPRQTPNHMWASAVPQGFEQPEMIAKSSSCAELIGGFEALGADFERMLLGARDFDWTKLSPYALAYGGHQFGNWAGQLGDGRAICLGKWPQAGLRGPKARSFELQLKGAGLTPYSRHADGQAVLRSSVREFLMSEAMYHLRVPTTRALSLGLTGERVLRDKLYDGRAAFEPGAVVCRVAPTFIRYGNFEWLAWHQHTDLLWQLIRYVSEHFLGLDAGLDKNELVTEFLRVQVRDGVKLVCEWERVGFVHGVLNTDNMSIVGDTIDYGPYGMLEEYDPSYTPNTTDLPGRRYAFGNQARILSWNLHALGSALCYVHEKDADREKLAEILRPVLDEYSESYELARAKMYGKKLGLAWTDLNGDRVRELTNKLLGLMKRNRLDYTLTFQVLGIFVSELGNWDDSHLKNCLTERTLSDLSKISFDKMLNGEASRQTRDRDGPRMERFRQEVETFLDDYVGCFVICYGKNGHLQSLDGDLLEGAFNNMQRENPVFVLRNYLLHEASNQLEKGDRELFDELYNAIQNPYDGEVWNNRDEKTMGSSWSRLVKIQPSEYEGVFGCTQLSCSS